MPQVALNALIVACRHQAEWLMAQSNELESGARKLTAHMRGKEVDLTPNLAAEYRHKARNLLTIIEVYERLHAKEEAKSPSA